MAHKTDVANDTILVVVLIASQTGGINLFTVLTREINIR